MSDVTAAPQLPHGIMGLQPQAFPWLTVILLGLALVGLAVLGWFLWKRWKAKTTRETIKSAVIPQDPWQKLDEALQKLDVQEPWSREACEEYFFRLSFILREALELRTGLPITGQTLAETTKSLEKSPALSANFQQDLIKFLSLAEQLKFAGQWLSATESTAWREKVKAWVDEFRRGALS
jgi:hypothetical protein